VTREWQFADRREDPHAVIGIRVGRGQQEGRLGKMGPAGERGHPRVVQSLGGMHHRGRIAAQRIGRKDIDLGKPERAHDWIRMGSGSVGWASAGFTGGSPTSSQHFMGKLHPLQPVARNP
jgi:hypothetical protein